MLVWCPTALAVLQQCPASMHETFVYCRTRQSVCNHSCTQNVQFHMMSFRMDRHFTSCRNLHTWRDCTRVEESPVRIMGSMSEAAGPFHEIPSALDSTPTHCKKIG